MLRRYANHGLEHWGSDTIVSWTLSTRSFQDPTRKGCLVSDGAHLITAAFFALSCGGDCLYIHVYSLAAPARTSRVVLARPLTSNFVRGWGKRHIQSQSQSQVK